MTYTRAAELNECFQLNALFRDPKAIADGCNLRWVRDPAGKVGFIKGTGPGGLLVHYPVKVLKNHVRLCVGMWTHEQWRHFELLTN